MNALSWPVLGQASALACFEHVLAFERQTPGSIGGSYILSGLAATGISGALDEFIRRLCGDAPEDIIRLEREVDKQEIGVARIRSFTEATTLSSFTGGYRIGIIYNAERLSLEGANALLKTLEDGRDSLIIFLLTSSVQNIPTTVVSRSQIIAFKPVPADVIYDWLVSAHQLPRELSKQAARLSGGLPDAALRFARDAAAREQALEPARIFIEGLENRLYERWRAAGEWLEAISDNTVDRAREAIAAWRLVARDMMLFTLNQPERTIYAFFEAEIRRAASRRSLAEIRRLDVVLKRVEAYLAANGNPKTALEYALLLANA